MAASNRHFNLTVPAADTAFFKTLAKKMGWTVKRSKAKDGEEHSPLYYRLQSAFRDVKLMMDGKKPKKTIEEFLAEFPDDPNEL